MITAEQKEAKRLRGKAYRDMVALVRAKKALKAAESRLSKAEHESALSASVAGLTHREMADLMAEARWLVEDNRGRS